MEGGEVEAYAKLQGKEETWYVKNLPFVFGRKSEKSPSDFVDICMGEPDKTVSREHAILTYSEEHKAYILEVRGKQGCFVNKQHIGKHEKCCLNDGDAVSMIKCQFYFLLPAPSVEEEKSVAAAAPSDSNRQSVKRPDPEVVDLTKKVEVSQESLWCVCWITKKGVPPNLGNNRYCVLPCFHFFQLIH